MIFDFQPYLKDVVEEIDRSKLDEIFVRPYMADYQYGECQVSAKLETEVVTNSIDIVDFCDEWLKESDSNRICLLGEYGTGKTTFCRWYAGHRAKKTLKSLDTEPVPILIPLHNFTKSLNVDTLITDFLVNKCQINNFRLAAFHFLLEQGRFLLLLDGFDEMARHVDREVRYQAITELSKLAKGKSKVILTGRPSFFPTDEELAEALVASESEDIYVAARNAYNEIVDFDLFEVKPFNRDQINEFIEKHVLNKSKAVQVLTYINSRYDVRDLVTRPVLLEMVVKSLPRLLELSPNKSINAGTLYNIYTGLWVDRELSKGEFRKLIKKDDKIRFMEELAYQLFSEDRTSISHRQLGEPIRTFFKIDDSDVDNFSHDIRTCSFLHRIPHLGYSFVHRSFQEFFVARKLIHALKTHESLIWGARHIPPEIIRFVSDLLIEEYHKTKVPLLEWAALHNDEILRSNALIVALLANLEFPVTLTNAYGMNLDTLQSYAAFKVGDETATGKFLEYIYNSVFRIACSQKASLVVYDDDEGKVKFADDIEYDVTGDVLYKSSKLLRQMPIKTHKEIDKYLKILVANELSGISRNIIEELKREVGFPELEAMAKADGYEFCIDDIPDNATPLDEVFDQYEITKVILSSLTPDEAKLVDYYFYKEMTIDSIGRQLNSSPNAVRAKVKRILTKLRRTLSSTRN